ncbi:uncharacterized protein LOC128673479 [Plodia interpunctella]|uniref:uncharacterized protein LOC128673479 n=1 Tax=Plodia interpunctella TaxID=58824 RepID=UPI002368B240|nr:uncharacterized protein LOC128673479 [Plodia interpunctella]
MSVWTSNYAIMRDLSKAQGRLVPVDMNSSVGVDVAANEKPPQLATEETEQEFYDKYACGDFDYSTKPDFSLIQQMLEMVRDGNSETSGSGNEGGVIQISKVNFSTRSDSENKGAKDKLLKAKMNKTKPVDATVHNNPAAGDAPVKKKKDRNVAMSSLLAAFEKENNNEPIKLLKPTDFMSTNAVNESVRKVDEWFTNKENTIQKSIPSLSSMPTFKKKSKSEKSDKQFKNGIEAQEEWFMNKENTTVQKSVPSLPTFKKKSKSDKQFQNGIEAQVSSTNTGIFKPSSKADEYYKKYLEKSQLKCFIQEDIWQKAERLMKEADIKRAAKVAQMLEEAALTEQTLQSLEDSDATPAEAGSTKLDVKWTLTEPRHTGTDDCIVCTTVQKHGFEINDLALVEKDVTLNTRISASVSDLD